MKNKEIKELLSEFLYYAPEELQKKFAIHEGKDDEFYFYGLIFRDEEVMPYDMVMFDKNDQSETYINLKPTLLEISKSLNILHSCLVLVALIDKYYREIAVIENNILKYLQYYDPRFKHKSIHHVTKHRSRERKFIKSDKLRDDKRWNTLLLSTFKKGCYTEKFSKYRGERPSSVFMLYPSKHEIIAYQNQYRKSRKL